MSDPLDEEALQQELDAMKALAKVLATMAPAQRRRLLEWARQFELPMTRSYGGNVMPCEVADA